jgi:hypothetical protein
MFHRGDCKNHVRSFSFDFGLWGAKAQEEEAGISNLKTCG